MLGRRLAFCASRVSDRVQGIQHSALETDTAGLSAGMAADLAEPTETREVLPIMLLRRQRAPV